MQYAFFYELSAHSIMIPDHLSLHVELSKESVPNVWIYNAVHHTSAGIMYQHKAVHYVCIIMYSVNGYFEKILSGPCQKCFNIHSAPWRYMWLIKKTGLEGQWKVLVFLYVILFYTSGCSSFQTEVKISICWAFAICFLTSSCQKQRFCLSI